MQKVVGFALFWIAVGMTITLMIKNTFFIVCIIAACLIVGYNIFCVRR